jgi:hypothetical protein
MTNLISFTSGELLDIIDVLVNKGQALFMVGDYQGSVYYANIIQQFELIHSKLLERPGEDRVADLVLVED